MHLEDSESQRDTEYPSLQMALPRPCSAPEGFLALPSYVMDENRTSSVLATTALTCLPGAQPTGAGGGKRHQSVSPQSLLPFGGESCSKVHRGSQNPKLPLPLSWQ